MNTLTKLVFIKNFPLFIYICTYTNTVRKRKKHLRRHISEHYDCKVMKMMLKSTTFNVVTDLQILAFSFLSLPSLNFHLAMCNLCLYEVLHKVKFCLVMLSNVVFQILMSVNESSLILWQYNLSLSCQHLRLTMLLKRKRIKIK